MDLRKLETFVHLVEIGNFTKTAELDHLTQTTVSQRIKDLEEYYGVLLIDRSSQPVKATKFGNVFYEEAKKILSQAYRLDELMRDINEKDRLIKIGYSSIFDASYLGKIIHSHSTIDEVKFELHKATMKEIASQLRAEKFDLAIGFDSAFIGYSDIEMIELVTGDYQIGVGPDHPLYERDSVSFNEVNDYPAIMLSKEAIGGSLQDMIERSSLAGKEANIVRFANDVAEEMFFIFSENLLAFFPKNMPILSEIKLIPVTDNLHHYSLVLAFLTPIRKEASRCLIEQIKGKINGR